MTWAAVAAIWLKNGVMAFREESEYDTPGPSSETKFQEIEKLCSSISTILKENKLRPIHLMLGGSITSWQMIGNLIGFIMPISFAVLIIIVRKYPMVDMVPLQLFAGIVAMAIGYLAAGRVDVSFNDIFLGFIAGFFQVGLGFIFITIGARNTPSAVVGIIMMTEAIFGPLWAWLFINEKPALIVFTGGSIILFAVFIQLMNKFFSENKNI